MSNLACAPSVCCTTDGYTVSCDPYEMSMETECIDLLMSDKMSLKQFKNLYPMCKSNDSEMRTLANKYIRDIMKKDVDEL